jgi:hypothetical protein
MPLQTRTLAGQLIFLAAAVATIVFALATTTSADVMTLRNGGEIRGEFVNDSLAPKSIAVSIRTVTGAEVTVQRSEIKSITRRRLVYEEYELRRRQAADDVAAQWELSEWCRVNELRDRRQTHLRRVLDFEPDHAEARKALGYTFQEGKWVTHDDVMTSRGYVKYKGRYVLPQELNLILQQQQESEAEKAWYRKVKMWYGWTNDGRADRRNEGTTNLQGIRDPNAIPALYRTLSSDKNDAVRAFYVSILANIRDERVVGPLLTQSLKDESSEVRHAAVKSISDIGAEQALKVYVQALRNESNTVVNRAGYALGELTRPADFPQVIPAMISAIVTTHRFRVRVPDKNRGISVGTDGSMPQEGVPLPPDIAVMLATGQLPFGIQVNEVPPPGFGVRTKVITVQKELRNGGVVTALEKLTSKNFGQDLSSWQSWWLHAGDKAPQAAAAN